MYDKTPVYPHQQHLTWAHEPLKSVYVSQRLFTTLLLVPLWAIYYAILPRSFRPRPSWSITQVIVVKFTKRISKVTEVAGVTWGTRDPTQEPDETSLNETRFAWVPPLSDELRTGVVDDNEVQCLRVGGYCHMSAHESSGTSRIPPVEYRLLQHAPIPGALQDAAAVYAHIVTHHLGARKGPDGNVTLQPGTVASPVADAEHRQHFETIPGHHKSSDSVDPVISGNDATPRLSIGSSHLSRVNADPVTSAYRPRIILIGDSAGGNLVLALSRWIRDEGVLPVPDGMLLLSPSCDPSHTLPQVPASRRPRPHADTDYLLDTPEPRALLSRTFLGHHPVEMVYSPYVSPASEWVLSVFHGMTEGMIDLEPLGPHRDSRDYRDEGIKTYDCTVNGDPRSPDVRTPASNPFIRLPPGMGLFTEFPRAMIVVGDAERLEREVVALERALEYDGVRVRMVWAKDAVHDILIMGAWDERVREGVWKEIGKWVREVVAE
ncbi:alpha/beta-hydrolase [Lactarius akahatsu]|uniref:Alpha/beta-hydrolase n=1 Tax=Lactarius akahatsu TaxID=416441 RepID=A0AAD4LPY1_9AGAM|nr:alpha/beta-hydrolase [Lactarius akahatsu]